jgi:hypothetical protein
MWAECTDPSNRRTARPTERFGALAQRTVEGEDPPEKAPPSKSDGPSTGLTAVDEELVGAAEDSPAAAVAPVRERGRVGRELLTPRSAVRSCGLPRCSPGTGGGVVSSWPVDSGGDELPGCRPGSSSAGYRAGGSGRCSPVGRRVNSDTYLRLVEGVVCKSPSMYRRFLFGSRGKWGATPARAAAAKNYFKIPLKNILEEEMDLLPLPHRPVFEFPRRP